MTPILAPRVKPRIRLTSAISRDGFKLWGCRGAGRMGLGSTPAWAFDAWRCDGGKTATVYIEPNGAWLKGEAAACERRLRAAGILRRG